MKLKEVTVINKAQAYSAEFFKEVSTQPEGKLFAFEQDLPETTIRSQAATYGKALKVKFTVVAVPVPEGQKKAFAVGVTTKIRKTRSAKPAKPENPVNVISVYVEKTDNPEIGGPSAGEIEAVEAIVDQEGI